MAVSKDKKDLANSGVNRELEALDIVLLAKVDKTALTLNEYINFRLLQGSTLDIIKRDLLTDLYEGGRIFGEFRNALKPTFAGSTSRFRDIGMLDEVGLGDFRWSAVLINTCESPDGDDEDMMYCMSRHGRVKSWADWEEVGLPRAGATVCGQNCKCVLLPAEATVLEPIMRGN